MSCSLARSIQFTCLRTVQMAMYRHHYSVVWEAFTRVTYWLIDLAVFSRERGFVIHHQRRQQSAAKTFVESKSLWLVNSMGSTDATQSDKLLQICMCCVCALPRLLYGQKL